MSKNKKLPEKLPEIDTISQVEDCEIVSPFHWDSIFSKEHPGRTHHGFSQVKSFFGSCKVSLEPRIGWL